MLCSRTQNLLSAYCDRELAGAEMLEIQRHLGRCPECAAEHQSLVTVKRLLGAAPSSLPDVPFDMALIETRAARGHAWLRMPRLNRAHLKPLADAWMHGQESLRQWVSSSSLRWDGGAVALGCAVGALVLTLGTVRQSHRAATAAQIPMETAANDASFAGNEMVGLPLFTGALGSSSTYSPGTGRWAGNQQSGGWRPQSPSSAMFVGYDSGWTPR